MDTCSWINFIRNETETALTLLYDYMSFEISREDEEFVKNANSNSAFWRLHNGAVQTALFIYLGRISDDTPDGKSFSDFNNYCFKNIADFNQAAFLERKPDILNINPNFLDESAEITEEDLKKLFSISSKYNKFMRGSCKTIRSKVFAHAILTEKHENQSLFADVSLHEIESALLAYWSVAQHLWQRFHNARNFEYVLLEFFDKKNIYENNSYAVAGRF